MPTPLIIQRYLHFFNPLDLPFNLVVFYSLVQFLSYTLLFFFYERGALDHELLLLRVG